MQQFYLLYIAIKYSVLSVVVDRVRTRANCERVSENDT